MFDSMSRIPNTLKKAIDLMYKIEIVIKIKYASEDDKNELNIMRARIREEFSHQSEGTIKIRDYRCNYFTRRRISL